MRAIIAISLFAALAIAGCASNNDDSNDAAGGEDNMTNTTPTPTPSPTPAPNCVNPVGPCIEPPAPSRA